MITWKIASSSKQTVSLLTFPKIELPDTAAMSCQELADRAISHLENGPFPTVRVFRSKENGMVVCLIMRPQGNMPIHFTVEFPDDVLRAPKVRMQSRIKHEKVFGSEVKMPATGPHSILHYTVL